MMYRTIATLVAGLVALIGPSATTVAADAGARPHGQHTRITLHVTTCRHCPVRLVQAGGSRHVWHSPTKRIRHGVVSFRVLTRHTYGMSFEIRPRWSSAGYIPNIVTRYGRTHAGDMVTNAVAKHKKFATGCWAGTSARRVSLDVRAVRFPLPDMLGHPGHSVRAWFKPTLASTLPMVRTTKGAIGNQDAFYCNH
jgi:hypothetical protein